MLLQSFNRPDGPAGANKHIQYPQVVNKMDRPALNGFEIIEQIEKEFGLASFPVTWPIGSGDRFCGLYHRPSKQVCARAVMWVWVESRVRTV